MSSSKRPSYDITRTVAFKFVFISNHLSRQFYTQVADRWDLSLTEWRVLAVVSALAPIAAVDITRRFGIDRMNMSRAVQRLVDTKRIERVDDEADRRRILLQPTAKGLDVYNAIASFAKGRNDSLLDGLSAKEREWLESITDRLLDNAQKLAD